MRPLDGTLKRSVDTRSTVVAPQLPNLADWLPRLLTNTRDRAKVQSVLLAASHVSRMRHHERDVEV